MELLLHIGHEKTGSTSIQESLTLNIRYLESIGISPSRFSISGNDHVVPAMFSSSCETYELLGIKEGKRSKVQNIQKKNFEKYLMRLKSDTKLILSSEHFVSRLCTIDEISNLAGFLKNYFDKITIVIVLRNQGSLHEGIHWEHLKSGFATPLALKPDYNMINSTYYNYRALIENWESAFRKERIRIINYDSVVENGESIVKIFFDVVSTVLGIEIDSVRLSQIKNLNVTPGAFYLEFLRHLNNQLILENPSLSAKPYLIESEARKTLIESIQNLNLSSTQLRVDSKAWSEAFQDSNEFIEKHYLNNDKIFSVAKSKKSILNLLDVNQSQNVSPRCEKKCVEFLLTSLPINRLQGRLKLFYQVGRRLKRSYKRAIFTRGFANQIMRSPFLIKCLRLLRDYIRISK